MTKPPDHWVLDLLPLMALLLASACMYVLRYRRDARIHGNPQRIDLNVSRHPFSQASMQASHGRTGTMTHPMPLSSLAAPERSDSKQAWNTLQAGLLRLVEQDERGGANIQDLHRVVADYDARRNAAVYRDGL
jgi:hypothetical protein